MDQWPKIQFPTTRDLLNFKKPMKPTQLVTQSKIWKPKHYSSQQLRTKHEMVQLAMQDANIPKFDPAESLPHMKASLSNGRLLHDEQLIAFNKTFHRSLVLAATKTRDRKHLVEDGKIEIQNSPTSSLRINTNDFDKYLLQSRTYSSLPATFLATLVKYPLIEQPNPSHPLTWGRYFDANGCTELGIENAIKLGFDSQEDYRNRILDVYASDGLPLAKFHRVPCLFNLQDKPFKTGDTLDQISIISAASIDLRPWPKSVDVSEQARQYVTLRAREAIFAILMAAQVSQQDVLFLPPIGLGAFAPTHGLEANPWSKYVKDGYVMAIKDFYQQNRGPKHPNCIVSTPELANQVIGPNVPDTDICVIGSDREFIRTAVIVEKHCKKHNNPVTCSFANGANTAWLFGLPDHSIHALLFGLPDYSMSALSQISPITKPTKKMTLTPHQHVALNGMSLMHNTNYGLTDESLGNCTGFPLCSDWALYLLCEELDHKMGQPLGTNLSQKFIIFKDPNHRSVQSDHTYKTKSNTPKSEKTQPITPSSLKPVTSSAFFWSQIHPGKSAQRFRALNEMYSNLDNPTLATQNSLKNNLKLAAQLGIQTFETSNDSAAASLLEIAHTLSTKRKKLSSLPVDKDLQEWRDLRQDILEEYYKTNGYDRIMQVAIDYARRRGPQSVKDEITILDKTNNKWSTGDNKISNNWNKLEPTRALLNYLADSVIMAARQTSAQFQNLNKKSGILTGRDLDTMNKRTKAALSDPTNTTTVTGGLRLAYMNNNIIQAAKQSLAGKGSSKSVVL